MPTVFQCFPVPKSEINTTPFAQSPPQCQNLQIYFSPICMPAAKNLKNESQIYRLETHLNLDSSPSSLMRPAHLDARGHVCRFCVLDGPFNP